MTNTITLLMQIIEDCEAMAQRSVGEPFEKAAFENYAGHGAILECHDKLQQMRRDMDDDVRDTAAELMGVNYV